MLRQGKAHERLASPPGHSPKAERWPGTDCLRMLQNYPKTGVISKTSHMFGTLLCILSSRVGAKYFGTCTSGHLSTNCSYLYLYLSHIISFRDVLILKIKQCTLNT